MAEQGEGIKNGPLFRKIARGAAAVGVLAAGYVGEGIKPVNADTPTSPTATSTSTGTPTPDAIGTQLAQIQIDSTITARNISRREQLNAAIGTGTAAAKQLEDLSKSPTATPEPPKPTVPIAPSSTPQPPKSTDTPVPTATPNAQATADAAEARRIDALGKRQAEIKASATADAESSATAKATPKPIQTSPVTPVSASGGSVENNKDTGGGLPFKEIGEAAGAVAGVGVLGLGTYKAAKKWPGVKGVVNKGLGFVTRGKIQIT